MPEIDPSSLKAMCFESSTGPVGVGIYAVDDKGCPRTGILQVEMTPTEMVELAYDLLYTARRINAGEAYAATMFRPIELTPDDEQAILSLLRGHQPPDHQECCS